MTESGGMEILSDQGRNRRRMTVDFLDDEGILGKSTEDMADGPGHGYEGHDRGLERGLEAVSGIGVRGHVGPRNRCKAESRPTRMGGVQSNRINALPCGGVHPTGDVTGRVSHLNELADGWMDAGGYSCDRYQRIDDN